MPNPLFILTARASASGPNCTAAAPSEEKVQGLQKQIAQRNPLGTFLEASELVQQQGHDAYGLHVLDEKREPAAAGQGITSDFELIDPVVGGGFHRGHALVSGMWGSGNGTARVMVSLSGSTHNTPDTNKKPHSRGYN